MSAPAPHPSQAPYVPYSAPYNSWGGARADPPDRQQPYRLPASPYGSTSSPVIHRRGPLGVPLDDGGMTRLQPGRMPPPGMLPLVLQPPQPQMQQPPPRLDPESAGAARQRALWAEQAARNASALSKAERTLPDENDGEALCPLCVEPLDETDSSFEPCPCGYRVCLFCIERIKSELKNICPNCRTPYDQPELYHQKVEAAKREAEEAQSAAAARQAESKAAAASRAENETAGGDGEGRRETLTLESALNALAAAAAARRARQAEASPAGRCAQCGAARGEVPCVLQRWPCGHAACRACSPSLRNCPVCGDGGPAVLRTAPTGAAQAALLFAKGSGVDAGIGGLQLAGN